MSVLSHYRPEVRRALPALVFQRWISNVGIRVMFTFLPSFARGANLSVEQFGRVLTLRDLMGLIAPLTGRLTDNRGTRPMVLIGGTAAALGILLSVFSPVGLAVGFAMMGLGKMAYDVALNSWVGDEVAYERRGQAFGFLELSWAAAALIGLPLCGLLIDHVAWWSVPLVFGALGLLASVRIAQVMPRPSIDEQSPPKKLVITPNIVWTLLGIGGLIITSQFLFVSHGLWLEDTYGLNPGSIGSVVVIFGIIEAAATLTTTTLTDRLGKRNSILAGSVLLAFGTAMLAFFPDVPLGLGLAFLGVAFLGFEFAFVSSLPLVAELDPDARAQVMGLTLGFSTVLRGTGTLVGTTLYVNQGFGTVMTAATAASLSGLLIIFFFIREPVPSQGPQTVMK